MEGNASAADPGSSKTKNHTNRKQKSAKLAFLSSVGRFFARIFTADTTYRRRQKCRFSRSVVHEIRVYVPLTVTAPVVTVEVIVDPAVLVNVELPVFVVEDATKN